jgi:hypothetical protein
MSLVIRKTQTKTTERCPLMLIVEWLLLKLKIIRVGKDMEKLEHFCTVCGKQYGSFSKF